MQENTPIHVPTLAVRPVPARMTSCISTSFPSLRQSHPLGGCFLFDDLTDELTAFSISHYVGLLVAITAHRNPGRPPRDPHQMLIFSFRTHVSPLGSTGSTGRAQHRAAANHTVTASNDEHSDHILKSASTAWTGVNGDAASALTDTKGAGRSAWPRNAVAAGLNVPSASAGCTLALNAVRGHKVVTPTPHLPTPQTNFLPLGHHHQHRLHLHHADPAFIKTEEDNFTSACLASTVPFSPHPHPYDDFQATAQEPYFGTVTSGAVSPPFARLLPTRHMYELRTLGEANPL